MNWLLDYHYQYTAVLALSAFFFCNNWVKPRFGIPASLLLAFCAYSAIWVWAFVQNRYVNVDPYNQMALRYFAADSIAKIMLICVPMMLLAENRQRMLLLGEIACSTFVVGNSAVALWEARNGCTGLTCGGLIGNPSISMGLMVCILPVFIRSWKQWPILVMACLAVFLSKSSIAVGLLAAYACLYSVSMIRKSPKWLLFPFFATAAIFSIAHYAIGGKELLNDSDRFMVWKEMLYHWNVPGNFHFGTGIGTYHVFSINLQQINHIAGSMWWNTLHNDWLQMLFECGVVGVSLLIFSYCSALRKIWREKNWPISISIILYGIYMALDPALHNPVPILFGVWLFTYALRRDNLNTEYT